MKDTGKEIGEVLQSSPGLIALEISDAAVFEANKENLSIGQYLLVAAGNTDFVLASVGSIKATHSSDTDSPSFRFLIETQPVGTWSADGGFQRGAHTMPVPTEKVYAIPSETLREIFGTEVNAAFPLGTLSIDPKVSVQVNGDRFFGKHIAIVGSTGSGKSCAVASILQGVVGLKDAKNTYKGAQRNAHIVMFDIHSEYAAAFRLHQDEGFTLNVLDVDTLVLPYWLMNAEELEEMFIESNEINSHNQISQFRHAVVRNKMRHNQDIDDISFDTPVYFSITEVCNYLENMNVEVIGKLAGEGKPKLENDTLVNNRDDYYFDKVHSFVTSSTAKDTKASNGPFNGEFDRLVLRLRTRLEDPRLAFLLKPTKDGNELKTEDFADVVRQFTGYLQQSNISIVDVSGVPFEVLSIVVSLISRMIFDFGFHYSKLRHKIQEVSDVPIMIVCEEAHNYVPRSGGAQYNASRKSIERIAKEGRKYGVTLMVVSQRPSEVSETIFSQCSNFVALRLTNVIDQSYIKSLLPDLSAGIGDLLPNLAQGEFLAVGDAVLMPTVGKFALPNPEPQSRSVMYLQEWNREWQGVDFDSVIARWRKKKVKAADA